MEARANKTNMKRILILLEGEGVVLVATDIARRGLDI